MAEDGAKTNICPACGAGPFNEKGIAMHSSRWCKGRVQNGAKGMGGGFGSPLEDILGISGEQPSSKRMKGSDLSLSPVPRPSRVSRDVQHGRAGLRGALQQHERRYPADAAPGPGTAGGFARGLMDMMARTFSGGFSGGTQRCLGKPRVGNMNATAEQEYTSELHIDVEVYKRTAHSWRARRWWCPRR